MLRTVLALLAAAPGLVLAQLQVVATSPDLKALVEAVGGAAVRVETLVAPGQDPHTVEIKPAQLARVRAAALLVRVGLDHEPWLARISIKNIPILDVSRAVKLLQTETPRLRTERRAHVHAFGNTHYWLDPGNARPITGAIAASLSTLKPEGKAEFERNRAAFIARLDAKILEWEKTLAPYKGEKVVVMHDSWAYFAARFGLQIVAAAEPQPGVPPSPAELAALIARMRESRVRLILAEPHADPALVRQIAAKSGARAVTLSPSGTDYLALFDENVGRIAAALGQP